MSPRATCVTILALALTAAGCASGAAGPLSTPVVSVTSVSPGVSPSTPAGTVAATPVGAATTDFGYFPRVESSGPPIQLAFDRAQFLTGAEADKAAAAHGDETPVPNDYYIVNDNTLLRTVTLSDRAKVTGSLGLNTFAGDGGVEPTSRTVEQLMGFLATDQGRHTAFHLVYRRDGLVVAVEEQYQP